MNTGPEYTGKLVFMDSGLRPAGGPGMTTIVGFQTEAYKYTAQSIAFALIDVCRTCTAATPRSELAGTESYGHLFPPVTIRQGRWEMMFRKTLTSVALAAGFATALAMPVAQAQAQSAHSDGLLTASPELRQGRMDRECGAIGNAHLRAGCIDSLNIDQDRRSLDWHEGLTGGGTGTMSPMGPSRFDPNMPITDAGR